jgi:uncharacterized protein with ATP-grasp and redox domains
MSIQPGCIPCIVKQAYNLSKMAGISNHKILKLILYETMDKLLRQKDLKTAPHFSIILQSIIGKYIDIDKTLTEIKERNFQKAVKFIKYLSFMIEEAQDKLEMSLRASIAGNTIDPAANPDFNIEREINIITSGNIILDSLPKFKDDLQKSERILFIGDNYEEALFDKFLIQQLLPKEISFAVRSNIILNDITMKDARMLEIDKLCRVVESGNIIAGVDLEECTPGFLELYNNADMVIAKGQGNYETLFNAKRPIYFMFKVKCEVISEICGYPVGTSMLYYHDGNNPDLQVGEKKNHNKPQGFSPLQRSGKIEH